MAVGQVVSLVTVEVAVPAVSREITLVPPQWEDAISYNVGDMVTHESVSYQATLTHVSDAVTNEPDAVSDADWQLYWSQVSVSWGDYIFRRVPEWLQQLDAAKGDPLRRFLRIFARSLNQMNQDGLDFPLLKDPLLTPEAFIEDFGLMLGLILPTPLPEERQRLLLRSIVQFYKAKSTKNALEFIASRYTNAAVTIHGENLSAKTYQVTVVPPSGLTPAEEVTLAEELDRILKLFQPAGLNPETEFEDEDDVLNMQGSVGPADASDSFTVNPIPGSPTS